MRLGSALRSNSTIFLSLNFSFDAVIRRVFADQRLIDFYAHRLPPCLREQVRTDESCRLAGFAIWTGANPCTLYRGPELTISNPPPMSEMISGSADVTSV